MLLRVKENELQYLKKEVQCLRDELQVMHKVGSGGSGGWGCSRCLPALSILGLILPLGLPIGLTIPLQTSRRREKGVTHPRSHAFGHSGLFDFIIIEHLLGARNKQNRSLPQPACGFTPSVARNWDAHAVLYSHWLIPALIESWMYV